MSVTVVTLAAALAVGACGEKSAADDLFPLEPGHVWTYHQQVETSSGRSESSWLVMRTLPEETYDGLTAYRRHSNDGIDYWLRKDATGIYRVATKHELEDAPAKDPAPRYVLKEPFTVGTEWQATTVPYLLERRQGFPLEVRHEGKAVTMRYEIEATDDAVTVPAGRFEHCLRVRGAAVVRLYADGLVGWRDMPLTTLEWYCHGPGLVKLERDEPANSVFLSGGKLELELHQWERP